jgi:hypothetical protein
MTRKPKRQDRALKYRWLRLQDRGSFGVPGGKKGSMARIGEESHDGWPWAGPPLRIDLNQGIGQATDHLLREARVQ